MAFCPGKVLGDIDNICRNGSARGLLLKGEESWLYIASYADSATDRLSSRVFVSRLVSCRSLGLTGAPNLRRTANHLSLHESAR